MKFAEAIDRATVVSIPCHYCPGTFANYYSAPKEHKRKYGGKEGYLN